MAQCVNHFEHHFEISTKNKLFKNISRFYDEHSQFVFKHILPLTFCVKVPVNHAGEVDKKSLTSEIRQFKTAFKLLAALCPEIQNANYLGQKSVTLEAEDTQMPRDFSSKFEQPLLMPVSHFKGKNIWILKPTGLNRGKGIHVCDSVKEVKRLIKQTCLENAKALP